MNTPTTTQATFYSTKAYGPLTRDFLCSYNWLPSLRSCRTRVRTSNAPKRHSFSAFFVQKGPVLGVGISIWSLVNTSFAVVPPQVDPRGMRAAMVNRANGSDEIRDH